MGCVVIGKVTIVVNKGTVIIGKRGIVAPATSETDVRGAGSGVSSDQIRDTVNEVRDEIDAIGFPFGRRKRNRGQPRQGKKR